MNSFRIDSLPPRTTVIEKFSSFYMFQEENQVLTFNSIPDPQLVNHFKLCQKHDTEFNKYCVEKNIALILKHFLENYQNDSHSPKEKLFFRNHVVAFLEEPRYKAAKDRFSTYKNFESPQNTWEEYVYIGGCLGGNIEKISNMFKRYNSDRYDLETHFQLEIASYIRDKFHDSTGQGKYSLWYNLKKASKTKLRRGLEYLGIGEADISRYLTARDCLFDVYSNKKFGSRWLEPNAAKFQEATDYYNRHYCNTDSLKLHNNHPLDSQTFKTWIEHCIKVLQLSSGILSSFSYDDAINKPNETETLWLESFNLSRHDKNLVINHINTVLLNEIEKFDALDRTILKLSSFGMKQNQIATQIGINQGTVSRHRQRSERQLLKAAAAWCQTDLEISLNETSALEEYIQAWVQYYYQQTRL